ncbi:thioredoxin family protein [Ramlibacter solisilvae]|uniref:Alkyl hydroperoxide reductase n=1 Tax=Ramlibacter tataouinensis TaxID=94132 RepID=A0A127JU25_9BURK|nr:thioredoxin family protein [Ramlibacter tataouinensis]AMO23491.1 alkyl hydroperoxide reductase [Ramlibacter tataouinensis]
MLRRALLALTALACLPAAQAAPAVGQAAPDFTLKDTTGRTVKLSDYRGKYVVLEWTNPGCPYVKKHYNSSNMQATQQDAIGKGAVWLSINSTNETAWDYMEPGKFVAWQQEKKARPTATLMDEEGTVGRAYGARTTPHMYIVDPQGGLVYAGGIDSIPSSSPDDIPKAVNYVKQGLGEAMAGKPVSQATTRPYGCSIKYKSA